MTNTNLIPAALDLLANYLTANSDDDQTHNHNPNDFPINSIDSTDDRAFRLDTYFDCSITILIIDCELLPTLFLASFDEMPYIDLTSTLTSNS